MSLDIGLVAPNIVTADGQGRAMLELARAAARRGHRLTLYARSVDPSLLQEGATWQRMPTWPAPDLVLDLGLAAAARTKLAERGHHVVCVMGPCAFPPAPYVYYAEFCWHGWREAWERSIAPAGRHRLHARLAGGLERRAVRRAAAVIAVSDQVRGELTSAIVPAPLPPTTLVPNGVDADEFAPPTPQVGEEARRRFGLGLTDFVIGFVGEFNTPRKGLTTLLDALDPDGRDDERVLVAGEGPAGALDRAGPRVRAVGRVVPVQPVFHASDIIVVPSTYEPFSLVAFEAAATGVALIVSARAGAAGYLGDAAWVVEPDDPAGIRRAIDAVRANEPERKRRVDRARALVAELRWHRTAAAAADVLEQVAGGR